MTDIVLGPEEESIVAAEVASGRYDSAADVVRHALRMLAEPPSGEVDDALGRGLDDLDAGRLREADAVFDELEARYAAQPRPHRA